MIKRNKNRKNKSVNPRPRFWILSVGMMSVLVAFTVGNSRDIAVVYARERNGNLEIIQKRNPQVVQFNIAAGRLEDVIKMFEKIVGWQVKIEINEILDVQSAGVTGNFTPEQALQKILEGTGINYSFEDSKTIHLELRAENATVEIKDSDAKIVSSPKYTEPLRDIPQTITVIPKAIIEQQGATTLRDVLQNVPGITLTAGEGGAPAGDNLTIRGFSARNDIYVDGVRDLGPQSRDPFNLEQVEVVKGPSSTFTGRGSTGGTINLVSKLPNLRKSVAGTFALGTDKTRRGTIDVNLPVKENLAFRVNAVGHDSRFAGRDVVRNSRWGIAPSLMFNLKNVNRFNVSFFHLRQENISDYGIPWVPATNDALINFRDRPAPVPRETFYGFTDRDKEKLLADLLTIRYERDFNDKTAIRNQFRYGYSRRDSIATPPRFNNNDSTLINRELRSWITNDDVWDNQTDFTARFKTGFIEHSTVFGANLTYEKNIRVLRSAPNAATTLLNPNPNDIYTGVITTSPFVGDISGKTYAVYAFDTIKFDKRFEFTGGLRFDYFDVAGVSAATTGLTPLARVDRILSGRAALIYKPLESGSIYVSYGTSANPSLEGLSYGVANTRIDPEKTHTYELGAKWEFFAGRLLLAGAVFRVNKTNARTPGILPDDPPQILDGRQRVDGIELSATGNITRSWQIFAGYTLLDSEIVRSNAVPTLVNGIGISEVGKKLINTPRNSFNLWTTYSYKKIFFGGGPRFVDRRFGNTINTRFVDSYWLADAMISYQVTKNIDFRVNAYNLTDKFYFNQITGGHVVPGAGRSILFSTGFHF